MSNNAGKRFNPPPNWPTPPSPDWQPPAGWQPDPAWGPPPAGHELWVDAESKKKGKKGKIIGGVAAAIVLIAIFGNLGGGDKSDTQNTAAEKPAAAESAAPAKKAESAKPAAPAKKAEKKEEPAKKLPGIGDAVRDGKFEFVVTGVEKAGKEIGPDFLKETAQGEFVIIKVDVTNIGDKGQMLDSTSQVLFNNKGQQYEPSTAIFALENADKAFLENINPGNKVTGAPLLFDVPEGTALDSIELHDSMFSGGVKVQLNS